MHSSTRGGALNRIKGGQAQAGSQPIPSRKGLGSNTHHSTEVGAGATPTKTTHLGSSSRQDCSLSYGGQYVPAGLFGVRLDAFTGSAPARAETKAVQHPAQAEASAPAPVRPVGDSQRRVAVQACVAVGAANFFAQAAHAADEGDELIIPDCSPVAHRFHVGQRVRLSANGRQHELPHWRGKTETGTVTCLVTQHGNIIMVQRDGVTQSFHGLANAWEPIPALPATTHYASAAAAADLRDDHDWRELADLATQPEWDRALPFGSVETACALD